MNIIFREKTSIREKMSTALENDSTLKCKSFCDQSTAVPETNSVVSDQIIQNNKKNNKSPKPICKNRGRPKFMQQTRIFFSQDSVNQKVTCNNKKN